MLKVNKDEIQDEIPEERPEADQKKQEDQKKENSEEKTPDYILDKNFAKFYRIQSDDLSFQTLHFPHDSPKGMPKDILKKSLDTNIVKQIEVTRSASDKNKDSLNKAGIRGKRCFRMDDKKKNLLDHFEFNNFPLREVSKFIFKGEKACLYNKKKIAPTCITKGATFNFFLLSTLSALAEYPENVIDLFLEDNGGKLSTKGEYVVKIYINGMPVPFRIDEKIPINDQGQTPIMEMVPDNQIWPYLISKAYSAAYGGTFLNQCYGGEIVDATANIFGGPVEFLLIPIKDTDNLWDRMGVFYPEILDPKIKVSGNFLKYKQLLLKDNI